MDTLKIDEDDLTLSNFK